MKHSLRFFFSISTSISFSSNLFVLMCVQRYILEMVAKVKWRRRWMNHNDVTLLFYYSAHSTKNFFFKSFLFTRWTKCLAYTCVYVCAERLAIERTKFLGEMMWKISDLILNLCYTQSSILWRCRMVETRSPIILFCPVVGLSHLDASH